MVARDRTACTIRRGYTQESILDVVVCYFDTYRIGYRALLTVLWREILEKEICSHEGLPWAYILHVKDGPQGD
jgi:hypothetical protein